jgi:hypothetical protein
MRDTEVIGLSHLIKGGPFDEYSDVVSTPVSEESEDGSSEVRFWVKHLRRRLPEKWTFTISRDYNVAYHTEVLQQSQPR